MAEASSEDDAIVETVPLFLNTALAPYLHSVSLPPSFSRPSDCSGNIKCRMKQKHGWLWVEQPSNPRHPVFQASPRPGSYPKSDHPLAFDLGHCQALVGDIEECSNEDLFAAVRCADGVYLTPLKGMADLRPSLLPIDLLHALSDNTKLPKAAATAKTSVAQGQGGEDDEEGAEGDAAVEKIVPQFRKRETEEQQAARLSSYEHLHRVWDEEPWTVMSVFGSESEEAVAASARLAGNAEAAEPISASGMEAFIQNLGLE